MSGYGVSARKVLQRGNSRYPGYPMTRQLTLNVGLSDHARIENFFAGTNAEAVHAVGDLVSGGSGLLVLYGEVGSGKTHLLYGAQKASLAADRRAAYLCLSDAEALEGLDNFEDPGFLVCVDDIDSGAGESRLERFLFNLVEHLRPQQGGILLACKKPPSECGFLMADLVSRLNSGASFRLAPLNDNDKAAAMRLRAEQRGFQLPDEVIAYVMRRFPRDASALFGLLDRIDRYSLSEQRKVTIPLIRELESSREGK